MHKSQVFGRPAKVTYTIETDEFTMTCVGYGDVSVYSENQSQWEDIGHGMLMMNPFSKPPIITIETDTTLIINEGGNYGRITQRTA